MYVFVGAVFHHKDQKTPLSLVLICYFVVVTPILYFDTNITSLLIVSRIFNQSPASSPPYARVNNPPPLFHHD